MYFNLREFKLFLGVILCIFKEGYSQVTVNGCPPDQTLTVHRTYWPPPTANSTNGAVTLTASHTPAAIFPDGETIVTYKVEDEMGNTDTSCTFKIIVQNDNAPNVMNCPSSITTETSAHDVELANVTWTEPTATSSVNGQSLDWSFRTHAPGDFFSIGTTTVFYEFVDSENNGGLCSFTVTVNEFQDNTAPMLECPDDIREEIGEGETGTTVTWIEPIPSGDYNPNTLSSTHHPENTFLVGDTVVHYFVKDYSGNDNECTFKVIITVFVPDTTAPEIYCPEDINMIVGPSVETYVVRWDIPTANDSRSAIDDIEISSNINSPYTVNVDTSTTVTYTATDEAGNEGECSFTITVSVDGIPTFENCPTNRDVEMTGVSTSVPWMEPAVTDDSTVTSNYDPGHDFTGPATYTVIYTAIDSFGSTATCSFMINLVDTTAPMITGCPSNIVRTVNNKNTAVVTWNEPEAVDDSGAQVTIDSNIESGSTFTNGETVTVIYTATDHVSLKSTCSFTVTVTGTTVCSDNPCQNDGICVTEGEDDFECLCVDDFTGDTCANDGLSTLQIIAISLGALAGLLILGLLVACCCYYCCWVAYGEKEEQPKAVRVEPQPHLHMGVATLPEPNYDNRLPGARFHNSLPRKSPKRKSGRRFRHMHFSSRRIKDAMYKRYGKQRDYIEQQ